MAAAVSKSPLEMLRTYHEATSALARGVGMLVLFTGRVANVTQVSIPEGREQLGKLVPYYEAARAIHEKVKVLLGQLKEATASSSEYQVSLSQACSDLGTIVNLFAKAQEQFETTFDTVRVRAGWFSGTDETMELFLAQAPSRLGDKKPLSTLCELGQPDEALLSAFEASGRPYSYNEEDSLRIKNGKLEAEIRRLQAPQGYNKVAAGK